MAGIAGMAWHGMYAGGYGHSHQGPMMGWRMGDGVVTVHATLEQDKDEEEAEEAKSRC